MPEVQPKKWLKWICSSKNLDELRENYNQWADRYEADISRVWEPVPFAAALILAEHINNKQGSILDVGAGTGLVGAALAELGFEKIIGIDISTAMLAKAAAKDVYHSLVCCSIGDEKFRKLERVSGIIATGVFAEAHAGPRELILLKESIKPPGILVFTARQSFLDKLQEEINQQGWILLDSQVIPIYDDPINLLAYKIL